MTSLEKAKRHLGKKLKIKIKSDGVEDEFELNPIDMEMYILMAGLVGSEEELSEEGLKAAFGVLNKWIELSYPDWPEDIRKGFVSNNWVQLMEFLPKAMPVTKFSVDKIKQLKKGIEKLDKNKLDKNGTETGAVSKAEEQIKS